MVDIGPYSNYRITARLELANIPGMFARVATVLAEEGANLGAVDIVSASPDTIVRDVTFDVQGEAHGERVIKRLNAIPDVRVLSVSDRIFLLHLGGKIRVESKLPLTTRNVLSMIYTPGVGRVSQAIAQDRSKAYAFTDKMQQCRHCHRRVGCLRTWQFRAICGPAGHGRQSHAL